MSNIKGYGSIRWLGKVFPASWGMGHSPSSFWKDMQKALCDEGTGFSGRLLRSRAQRTYQLMNKLYKAHRYAPGANVGQTISRWQRFCKELRINGSLALKGEAIRLSAERKARQP